MARREDWGTDLASGVAVLTTGADGAAVVEGYEDALPYPPPRIDADREATYRRLRNSGI